MANFSLIENRLLGLIESQITQSRVNQSHFEWFRALKRIMSSDKVAGTATLYDSGEAGGNDAAEVEVGSVPTTLYGALVDNPNAAEPIHIEIADVADVDGGDDLLTAFIFVPSATLVPVLYPRGVQHTATQMAYIAGTGTRAGLEAGTAVTGTNPRVILVYATSNPAW